MALFSIVFPKCLQNVPILCIILDAYYFMEGKNGRAKFKKINQYSKYKLIALQKLDIKERMDALVEKVKSLNEEQAKKVMLELEKCLE